MSKATAIAHPIQGILKYHGFANAELRIPLHDSISVCVAPYETRTTVELDDSLEMDVIEIDGETAVGRPYERAVQILAHVRQLADTNTRVRMRSENNFLSNIGLGASSSGFAALSVAATAAYDLDINHHEISTIARLGAGSASRAVAGGYSHWYAGTDHKSSYAEQIGDAETLPLGITIAVIPAYKNTDDAHAEVLTSPYLPCRIAHAKAALDDAKRAILDGDFSTMAQIAETDSLSLHAVTMTGSKAPLLWTPETMSVFHEVRKMRDEGLECYFSVDTGATVYINSRPNDQPAVQERVAALGVQVESGVVGGASRLINEHLF